MRIAIILAGAVLLCQAFALLPVQGDLQVRAAVNDGLSILVSALAAVALLWAARRTPRDTSGGRRRRRAWAVLAAAMVAAMIGVAIGLAYAIAAGRAPSPSPADAFFGLFYTLLILGLALFHDGRLLRSGLSPEALDQGVMVISSLMIYLALMFQPMVAVTSARPFGRLITLAYPLMHLVPVWLAMSLLAHPPRHTGDADTARPVTTSIPWLSLGTLALAAGDAAVNIQMLSGAYVSGSLYDLAFSAGLLLLGLAGVADATLLPEQHDGEQTGATQRLLIPLFWVAVAVAALLWTIVNGASRIQLAGMALGTIFLFILVFARQLLSSRENLMLARQLQRELQARETAAAELEHNRQVLEAKVEERTAALSRANAELQHEVRVRIQTEQSLDRQRAFLRQVIDTDPNFIFVKNRQGQYTLVNLALAYACGLTVDAMVGKTDAELIASASEVERYRRDDLEVLHTQKELFIAEETFTDDLGNTRWLQTVKRPIVGLDGLSDEVLGVSTDITARRRAETSSRLSESQYRMLFEQARDAIVIAEAETSIILDVNRATERLMGLFREDLVGLHQAHLHPPDMEEEYRRIYRQQMQTAGIISAEVLNSNGRRVPVEINSSVIELADRRRIVSGFIRDVSERAQAQADLHRAHIDLTRAYEATLEGWIRALDIRDTETEGHSRRVVELTVRLARRLGIPEDHMEHVRRGALLHDIGKLVIPDAILLKPGLLTDAEWETMRCHPLYARDILWPIDYLRPALDIPYYHHEKWDGTGYPCGLKGEQIPLAARLFAVVDVWDAVRYDRPYRKAWGLEQTLDHIRAQSGRQFDPVVVNEFLMLVGAGEAGLDDHPAPSALAV